MTQLAPPMRGPAWKGSPLMEEAHRLDERVRALSKEIRRRRAELADTLLAVQRGGHHKRLNFTSMAAYGRSVEGLGASTTSELLKIAEGCERLPQVAEAFRAGELPPSKAKVLVESVSPETEAEWLERARTLESTQLRAALKGETPVSRQTITWTDEQRAVVDDAVRALRDAGGPKDFAAALASICGGYLDGESNARGVDDTRRRKKTIVGFNVCAECGKATRETQRGPIEVSPEALAEARREGEELDLSAGPPPAPAPDGELKRAIPAAARSHVEARDGGRCRVPGCRNRSWLEADHIDRWKNGHDPDRIVMLCWAHHGQRSRGFLRIERHEDGPFRFYQVDGTFLGESGDRERASPSQEPAPASGGGEDFARTKDVAVTALRRLELPAREAKAAVERALHEAPHLEQRPVEELVRVALARS